MDLKNAVAVCLISLFSAALVVLIARSLDNQAAARLEPQLARIGDELEAIRQHGGIAAAGGAEKEAEAVKDGLIAYYFHGNIRCATCRAIESQSREVVAADFASEVGSGNIVWKTLNYEDPANAELVAQFDIQVPVVVLARMEGGRVADWLRLDEVWALVGDQPAFAEFIRAKVQAMLTSGPAATPTPVPQTEDGGAPDPAAPDLPLPTPSADSHLPK